MTRGGAACKAPHLKTVMIEAPYPQSVFHKLFDVIIDRIILFSDYFIVKKHVTLSETTLLVFNLSWLLWFFVGVPEPEQILSRSLIITTLGFAGTFHFASFFIENRIGRALAAALYAFVWSFLMFVYFYSGEGAPAAPTLFVMMMLSVFICVRLVRERSN